MTGSDRPTGLGDFTRDLKGRGVKPLVPFLTAGYPDELTFRKLLAAAAHAGCPIVEIGIPFSDPVADGPVIQATSQQALAQGMTLARSVELAGDAIRDHGLQVVLMGYLNPILKMGPDRFVAACGRAKVAGLIVPDLPPEEAGGLRELLAGEAISLIDLVAPTTDQDRLRRIAAAASGFLYLVSTTGVTGAGTGTNASLEPYVARVRPFTDLPLYVGFGISRPEHAAEVAAHADGAIVGSALLKLIAESGESAVEKVETYLSGMMKALNPE